MKDGIPTYPRSVRYRFWSADESAAAYDELLEMGRSEDDETAVPDMVAEVTCGRRLAGMLLVWLVGEKGLAVAPIPRDGRPRVPEFWIDDEVGSDVEAICLWLACDLDAVPFEPVYEELLALREQDRRTIRETLADRHGWGCHICGRPIPGRLRHAPYTQREPDPMFPDIEHVIPLRRGGLHFYGNLRLAHRVCNERKGSTDDPAPLRALVEVGFGISP